MHRIKGSLIVNQTRLFQENELRRWSEEFLLARESRLRCHSSYMRKFLDKYQFECEVYSSRDQKLSSQILNACLWRHSFRDRWKMCIYLREWGCCGFCVCVCVVFILHNEPHSGKRVREASSFYFFFYADMKLMLDVALTHLYIRGCGVFRSFNMGRYSCCCRLFLLNAVYEVLLY